MSVSLPGRRAFDVNGFRARQAALLLINGSGHLLNPDENAGAIDLEVADMTPEGWTAMSDFLDRTLGWP